MKRIYLEITNSCNLNCDFCTNKKGNSFLDIETIKHTIDEIDPICKYIYLHILGEPLLHPNFNEILDYLDYKNMNLLLVTNGILLNSHLDILNHSCLNKLSISINSIDNYPIDDSYFKTINTLLNNNYKFSIEFRFLDYLNLSGNSKDILDYLMANYDLIETNRPDSFKIKNNVYLTFHSLFKWPNIKDNIINEIGTCKGGKDMLAINHNLDVCLCCLDPNAHNKLGNLKEKSLNEIIKSKEYNNYLNDLKNNKINYDLCKRCSYRLRFSK